MAPSNVQRTNELPWIAVVRYGAPRHTRRRTEPEIADYEPPLAGDEAT